MITKTFDCVNMKNELQKKLYNDLEPENAKDYIDKLKESINNSKWINEIKKNSSSD